MKTVKELSDLTGISVRTLHYYDEIGLLKPTEKSEAGYRLYDEKALERLQQILFFREFDITLREIKAVLDSPALDQNRILRMQREMLVAKKERMERLIASIDDILKGDNRMDFAVFTKTEIEALCQSTLEHMPDFMRKSIIRDFGGIEQWRRHYVERCSKEDMQKGYQRMVEWYGDKDRALTAMKNPPSREDCAAVAEKIEGVERRLSGWRTVDAPGVAEAVTEYGALMKQLYRVERESGLMLSVAQSYRYERTRAIIDEKYGEGAAEFIAAAIEAYYIAPSEKTSQSS